ncbi:MAG: hypothetical protein QOE56_2387 [Solirubrobacterales bacterium]|jgi:nitrite reductase/ring-hydroxylating ferredoxin subunit|nr:hypothetical protein [Solirubrobacterales bacterium]
MAENLGKIGAFPDREISLREVEGRSVGIFRDGEAFYGMLNICPHRGAEVCTGEIGGTMMPSEPGRFVFGLDGFVLRCPWHRWAFDVRDGAAANGIDDRSLTMFEVTVRDGDVYADLHTRRPKRAKSRPEPALERR